MDRKSSDRTTATATATATATTSSSSSSSSSSNSTSSNGHSNCTMALGSTQPLTEISTRNIPRVKGR
jgi:hypothetical protein